MPAHQQLHDLLEQYRAGTISLDAAAEAIEGLRLDHIGEIARIDLGRGVRCGMPEVVLAEGKDPAHLAEITIRLAQDAGRCIVTRLSDSQVALIREKAEEAGIRIEYRATGRVLVAGNGPAPQRTGGIVAIVTAGTSDIRVAEEARIIAEEMGCEVRTAYDVGAAGIHRLFPALKPLVGAHAYIVCAGREGTLPAVVAGLVDRPVVGIPVSVGYGYMGEGQAALASMLQSCSVVAVVNIDAGFTGGAFAARIASLGAEVQGGRRGS